MTSLPFVKMHGLGNDFMMVEEDALHAVQGMMGCSFSGRSLPGSFVGALSDRHRGVGFDQLIILSKARHDGLADRAIHIYNVDGSHAQTCGNALRCLGLWLYQQDGERHHVIETESALLDVEYHEGLVRVDMGRVRHDWRDIPMRDACDTQNLSFDVDGIDLGRGVAVNIGNPHVIFFTEDVKALPLSVIGERIGRDERFPDGVNIGVARVIVRDEIYLRTWERGSGATQACGSNACACLVAASMTHQTDRRATIVMDGGRLDIEWLKDGHVMMRGDAAMSYRGVIDMEEAYYRLAIGGGHGT